MLIAFGTHLYLYLGMLVLVHFVNGEDWILGWKPAVGAFISAAVFAHLSFGWTMRLDARYGRGAGWTLERVSVKLPEIAERR